MKREDTSEDVWKNANNVKNHKYFIKNNGQPVFAMSCML